MNDERCQRYMEDPEGNASHLAECAECRSVVAALAAPVAHRPVVVEALPLAPWEGASHRAWPLVLGGALAVLAITIVVCAVAGLSPLRVIETPLRSMSVARTTIDAAAAAIRRASTMAQIGFGFLFIAVNTVLVLLLRRAPRGIDA